MVVLPLLREVEIAPLKMRNILISSIINENQPVANKKQASNPVKAEILENISRRKGRNTTRTAGPQSQRATRAGTGFPIIGIRCEPTTLRLCCACTTYLEVLRRTLCYKFYKAIRLLPVPTCAIVATTLLSKVPRWHPMAYLILQTQSLTGSTQCFN